MLVPTGFWSYTTSDEAASRGKLSQLRALLAAELQQQVGRSPKVNIFQDVAAIPPGREWERQIRTAIGESSFLIPIVTPAFLQSEWCCQEVDLFRQREGGLGARELVFPIHYVDTDELEGGEARACHDPAVLAFLRTRQWTDFRSLRFRAQESEEVSLVLERLARAVLLALRRADRPAPTSDRPEPEARRDPPADATRAGGFATGTAPSPAVSAAVRTAADPVAASGPDGTPSSVQAAARPGAETPARRPGKPKTVGEVIGNAAISTIVGTFFACVFAAAASRILGAVFGLEIGPAPIVAVGALAFVALVAFFVVDGAKERGRKG